MEELQEIRDKIKKRYIMGISITIVSMILLALIIPNILPFIFFLALFIIDTSTSKLNTEYKKIFKNTFVKKALEKKFTDLIYIPDKGIPYPTIASTEMMHMGDRYYSEDYISAKYKDIKFEQADVHIQEEHETKDRNTAYETIFKGRWMIFDFNKIFKANVQITQKGFGNSRVKRFFGKKEERFKQVMMESESFNQKFKVFAQNEHDAFYIITPFLMERIEKLDEENKGKFLFCFIDNRLHIGIYDNKNSFEPGSVFKKINEEEVIAKISKEIELITQFVDELNLNNDLFKKEV